MNLRSELNLEKGDDLFFIFFDEKPSVLGSSRAEQVLGYCENEKDAHKELERQALRIKKEMLDGQDNYIKVECSAIKNSIPLGSIFVPGEGKIEIKKAVLGYFVDGDYELVHTVSYRRCCKINGFK